MFDHGHGHSQGQFGNHGHSHGSGRPLHHDEVVAVVVDEKEGFVVQEAPAMNANVDSLDDIPPKIRGVLTNMVHEMKETGQVPKESNEFELIRMIHSQMMQERADSAYPRKVPGLGGDQNRHPLAEFAEDLQTVENGTTELHLACLRGNEQAIRLLLSRGSDPNARNALGQTPVHSAASEGQILLIHVLKKHGADVTVKDNQGWTAMHHAAASTSDLAANALHYLNECCGLAYYELTKDNQSLLHIAVKKRKEVNRQILDILLDSDRLNVHQVDSEGNNAMHYAVADQDPNACYRIASATGAKILLVANKNNQTPLDLARRTLTVAGYQMSSAFDEWIKRGENFKPNSEKPRDFYQCLLLPGLIYLTGVLITKLRLLPSEFQGWVCLAGLALSTAYMRMQSHRIYHISRLPNPTRQGFFCMGALYSIILWTIMICQLYEVRPITCLLLSIMAITGSYLYYSLTVHDAGRLLESKRKPSGEFFTMYDLVETFKKPIIWCSTCKIIPSKPAHHCKLCLSCHQWTDHHCLYTMNCVAFRNRYRFVLFCLVSMFACLLSLILTRDYADSLQSEEDAPLTWLRAYIYLFHTDGFVAITLVLVLGVLCFFATPFVYSNTKLTSYGYTDLFQPKPGTKTGLSFWQRCQNVFYYLFKGQTLYKDPAYMF